jgi:hypothetical protein
MSCFSRRMCDLESRSAILDSKISQMPCIFPCYREFRRRMASARPSPSANSCNPNRIGPTESWKAHRANWFLECIHGFASCLLPRADFFGNLACEGLFGTPRQPLALRPKPALPFFVTKFERGLRKSEGNPTRSLLCSGRVLRRALSP